MAHGLPKLDIPTQTPIRSVQSKSAVTGAITSNFKHKSWPSISLLWKLSLQNINVLFADVSDVAIC